MFVRHTFFRGRVKSGLQDLFDRTVDEVLIPLQVCFPGAEEVKVLRQVESDTEETRFEMILALRYPSRDAIERALASEVRARSRVVTQELLAMFDGDIFHMVFSAEDHAMIRDGVDRTAG